jgi:sulfopyruvate decarboxylase subunit beta
MRRFELFQQILPVLQGENGVQPLVVCNIGYPSRELYGLGDRHNFFYMLGSMGLASSIGLGLALNSDRHVVALDGDGSVLMNLGTLATIANAAPPNYTLLIVDNGSYGSTGDQPTFTAGRTRLAEMSRGAGVTHAFEVRGEEAVPVLRCSLEEPGPHVIVARVAPGSVPGEIIPLEPTAIRERFRTFIGSR